ncbi:alkane 1-monooxygenase [Pseudenhygromyxa sp. WMMC2535]|uniref:alkane 1-monooxygenase n=1 Tax=Pseudenhygromyxa sp. WMMC2535 TaxID=2712867 RepID=UPI001556130B|nr:alkane 1-monooxygenase [Pseudenhygromyxa sp. WMMC2535]NVB43037.1 alkane 1-monooxygenase [Pseudenhygromyxa sp. WMMC2535]
MSRLLPYFLIFMLPLMLVLGVEQGGGWSFAPLIFIFVAVPLLDAGLARDTNNQSEALGHQLRFDAPILLWIPVQLGTIAFVLARASSGALTGLGLVGAVISLGVLTGGGGINIAHELMHRKQRLHRAGAEVLMCSVSYTHFCVEHILGHHRKVATSEDPATSRLGESFYAFYPRTVMGGLISAWHLEGARCAARGVRGLGDRRLRYTLELAALYLGVGLAFGGRGLAVFVAQGVIGFSLLEVINYIEHYGLERAQLESGRPERVRPEHSWNSAHRVSNWFLFNLARHSDHHYLASREYDRLRHHEGAPQLPWGYAGMVLIALVPPLWFRVMNPRVRAWRARRARAEGSQHGRAS